MFSSPTNGKNPRSPTSSVGAMAARTLIASVLLVSGSAGAEVLKLDDGTTLEGVVKRTPDGYDVTDASGKVTHVDPDRVKGITIGSKAVGATEAESRLGSLRRSVENVSDLKAIIERYTRFVEQNKSSSAGKEAERELAVWKDRLDKQMVKVGSNWVTPEERAKLQQQGAAQVEEARQLLRQGRVKDADPLLTRALEVDPNNASAAFLKGCVLYKQDQVQSARKAFETVNANLKDHAPTLNNLAVLSWRQNQQPAALNFYAQAMQAAPGTREVLDNVAEALNALPANMRTNAATKRAAQLFAEQDAALQQQLAAQGWYRWGAKWVQKPEYDKLKAAEAQIQAQLDQMSADFDATKKKVDRLDVDIADNVKRMQSIENASVTTDTRGNVYRTPLPRRYYDLQAENATMDKERRELVDKLGGLREQAKKVQQQIPTPRFSGVQQIVGVEGTPGLAPAGGTPTAPAAPTTAADELRPPSIETTVPSSTQPLPSTTAPAPTEPPTPPLPAGILPAPPKPAAEPATKPADAREKVPDGLLSPQ